MRPEDLTLSTPGAGASLPGRVVAAVYQGSHIDVVVETEAARDGTLTVRCLGANARGAYAAGTPVSIGLSAAGLSAFPSCDAKVPE